MYIIWPFASGLLSLHSPCTIFCLPIGMRAFASVSIFRDKTMNVIYQPFGHCAIFMMNTGWEMCVCVIIAWSCTVRVGIENGIKLVD